MKMMKEGSSGGDICRIGQLAKAAGVSTDTLRHYERKGLLRSDRSRNGYREYSEGAVERVEMIRKALNVGFTLDELTTVFQMFDRGGAPCKQVRTLAVKKLAQIESHLEEVIAFRDNLKRVLKDWDRRLAKTASNQRAGLLKALPSRNSLRSSAHLLLRKRPKRKDGINE
jgi:DNA-binding transcriptional MerR regulator